MGSVSVLKGSLPLKGRVLTKKGTLGSGLRCLLCQRILGHGQRALIVQGNWFMHLDCLAEKVGHETEFDSGQIAVAFAAKRAELLERFNGIDLNVMDCSDVVDLDEVF